LFPGAGCFWVDVRDVTEQSVLLTSCRASQRQAVSQCARLELDEEVKSDEEKQREIRAVTSGRNLSSAHRIR